MDRRTLVRLLVVLGIGIPLVVEGATFTTMIDHGLTGTSSASTATPTTSGGVAVGDDLVAATPTSETVTDALVLVHPDEWTFTLTVRVENTGETPYELRLDAAETAGGKTISASTSTGKLAPGESKVITGRWHLPPGATPTKVDVVALTYGTDTSTEAVRTTVDLAKVPVRRS